jgi:hypothetical protein
MKKVISILFISTLFLIFIITATANNPIEKLAEEGIIMLNSRIGIPAGFIPFEEAVRQKQEEGIIKVSGFDNQITFETLEKGINLADTVIYQTSWDDDDLFVLFGGIRYINEEKFLDIIEIAKLMPEQRLRTYNVGEQIQIRGDMGKIYSITIFGIENLEIQFEITPNVSERELRSIFNSIEVNGRLNTNVVKFINMRTMRIETDSVYIPNIQDRITSDEVTAVILRSPEYSGLTYRVVLHERETTPDELTTADALAILRHVAGVETLSQSDLMKYDFNKDGNIDTSNALFVLRVVAGLAEEPEKKEESTMVFDIPDGVPEGYIPLLEAVERTEGVLSTFFFSTQIVFLDLENKSICLSA